MELGFELSSRDMPKWSYTSTVVHTIHIVRNVRFVALGSLIR